MARSTNLALLEARGTLGKNQLVVRRDHWGDGTTVILSKYPDMTNVIENPSPAQRTRRQIFADAVAWARIPENNAPFANADGKRGYHNALIAYNKAGGVPDTP